jgi:uncharacterized protein
MDCPVCDVTLSISSRESVEIDFCPQCRGVWLDRGELDKIIERAATSLAPSPAPAATGNVGHDRPPPRPDDRPYDDRRYDDRDRRYEKKRKRRSFLEDIFDFD